MELSCLKLKNSYIFSKKKKVLYFGKWNVLALSPKNKKIIIFQQKKVLLTFLDDS